MASERKRKDSVRQWRNNEISVSPATRGHISWRYTDSRGHAYVSVTTDKTWAYVTTDEYEGRAMFPKVLIPDVIRELKRLKP